VADDRARWDDSRLTAGYDPASEEFAELRELLLGDERRQIAELRRRLDAMGITAQELADLLPEAIALRAGRDRQLARALSPTVESAISESVRRNPREIASAIFPVLGPAIRKAIAETMSALVASINRAIEHSISPRGLVWRLEAWRTGVPYAQIVLRHALVYRVEQVFLIHAETGLLLAHVAPPHLAVPDVDLVSGMMTAIRDFVGDAFTRERDAGGLRTFSVGELTVMVEPGPRASIAAVVRGQPPQHLLAKLQDTLETIHAQWGTALERFEGDATPFEGTRPLLEGCLETVLATDRPRDARARPRWVPLAIAAALAIALVAVVEWRSAQQWEHAVARLDSQPGLVLARAERHGDRWLLSGLRDPLAPAPLSLLAGVGVDTTRVEGRWEPYISLQPSLVLTRAERALAAPASISLRLDGETLRVRGTAPLAWVQGLALSSLPPGVSWLDLSQVVVSLPDSLARLDSAIVRHRIMFAVGSPTLDGRARRASSAVARALLQLERALGGAGAHTTLELIGRTDPTGSDSVNQALSHQRAGAVAADLRLRGVPADVMSAHGVGTSDPLSAAGAADRATINRSVSFLLEARVAPPRRGPPR